MLHHDQPKLSNLFLHLPRGLKDSIQLFLNLMDFSMDINILVKIDDKINLLIQL